MDSAEPNSVVSGRVVEEYNACLFTCLKRVPDIVGEEGDRVHHRLPVVETRLLLRQLRVDACVDEAFHELVRDAEKRGGKVPLRSSVGSFGFGSAIILARRHFLGRGILDVRRQTDRKTLGHGFVTLV